MAAAALPVPPEQQKAMIEDKHNSAFLPSLRFYMIELHRRSGFMKKFSTPRKRLQIVQQLRKRAMEKDCIDSFDKIPKYSEERFPDSDAYVKLFTLSHYSDDSRTPIGWILPFIAYDTTLTEETENGGVVGYIEITIPVYTNIFFKYPDSNIHAAFFYINWTCSFTNIDPGFEMPEIAKVQAIMGRKLSANPGKKLSIGQFLLYNAMQYFIEDCEIRLLDLKKRKPLQPLPQSQQSNTSLEKIDLYVALSYALQEARQAHRKVGKRSACRFLEPWQSVSDPEHPTVAETFEFISEKQSKNNSTSITSDRPILNQMIYTYPQLVEGEPIYEQLKTLGADLNVRNDPEAPALNNASYRCPSGVPIMNYSNNNNSTIKNGSRRKRTQKGKRGTKRSRK